MTTRLFRNEDGSTVEIDVKQYYAKRPDGSYHLTDVPQDGLTPEEFNDSYQAAFHGFLDRQYDAHGPLRDDTRRDLEQAAVLAIHDSEQLANDPEVKAIEQAGRAESDISATAETDASITDFPARAQRLADLIRREFPGRSLSLSAVPGAGHWVHVWNTPVPIPTDHPYTSGHILSIESMMRREVNEKRRTEATLAALERKARERAEIGQRISKQYAFQASGADDVDALKQQVAELKSLIASQNSAPAAPVQSVDPAPAPAPESPATREEFAPPADTTKPDDFSLIASLKQAQQDVINRMRGR